MRSSLIFLSGELRVQTHRRRYRIGQPVGHYVIQQFIRIVLGKATVRQMFIFRIRPTREFFYDVSR